MANLGTKWSHLQIDFCQKAICTLHPLCLWQCSIDVCTVKTDSDFKVFTNNLCQPIRKGLELLLPGWGSWKWEWRARLWSKDGNHAQSWKTLVEETQEGDFCSLHWHFFAIVDQLSNSFLNLQHFQHLRFAKISYLRVMRVFILQPTKLF